MATRNSSSEVHFVQGYFAHRNTPSPVRTLLGARGLRFLASELSLYVNPDQIAKGALRYAACSASVELSPPHSLRETTLTPWTWGVMLEKTQSVGVYGL